MIPIQRYLLEKIATQWKEAAQDFSWFDPRVWGHLFNSKRARAQMKWAQSPTQADVITDKNGNKTKDYSRETDRAKYYGDSNKITRYAGNGQYYKQNLIGRPLGTASDPAQFERDLNNRYKKHLQWRNDNYKDVNNVQMAQGPDMTKNLPRTNANRAYVEAKANVDKQVNSAVQSLYQGFDNATTGFLRAGELTGAPGALRAISGGKYGETSERFKPWEKLIGKSNTWFQNAQAPKAGMVGRALNTANNWIVNNADGYGAVNAGLTTLGLGVAGNGVKTALLAPKASTAATKVAGAIGLGKAGYDLARGSTQPASNQTLHPQQPPPMAMAPSPTYQQPSQLQQPQQPQQVAGNSNPYGYNQNSNYSDDYHTEFGYMD
jgi:hypothetical protein